MKENPSTNLEKIYISPYRSLNFQQLFFYDIFFVQRVFFEPGRIVWPQVCQICTSQTEKFSRFTLILYFSLIKYWRNCRKICQTQTVSDRPKIIEKFSQPADENGHVLLPGLWVIGCQSITIIYNDSLYSWMHNWPNFLK